MKTSMLALAILGAFCGAASAQSNVTVYGLLDLGVVRESGGAAGPVTKLTSGVANGSRLGFKGTEDLGGGWSAIFAIENGFDGSTGAAAQGGLLFGRQAFVGLNSPMGSVKLGRQYTPVDELIASIDPFGNGMAGRMQNVLAQGYVARANNDVVVSTPNMGGLTATASYGFGEVAGDAAASRYVGAGASYVRGPLVVRLAGQKTNNAAANGAAKNMLLGGTYDFGVAKLHATYGVSKTDAAGVLSVDARDAMLGVSVPFGASTVFASYVRRDDRLAVDRNADQVAIGYTYDLSKRTTVYAAYGRIDNENGARYVAGNSGEAGSGPRAVNAGLRHKF